MTGVLLMIGFLSANIYFAAAQQAAKVPRIGYLTSATPVGQAARIEAFRQGLRELGYLEGKNIVVEYRYAELKPDRLSAVAAELVKVKGQYDSYGCGWNDPCGQRSN